jgi:protein O-GlcNAc transferase
MNDHSGIANKALKKALAYQSSGRLGDAERLFRSVLQSQPHNSVANYGLGVLALKQGKVRTAIPFLNVAVNADQHQEVYWCTFAEALIEAGALRDARTVIDKAVLLGHSGPLVGSLPVQLKYGEMHQLALQHHEAGRLADATQGYTEILASDPFHVDSLHMLGVIAMQTSQFELAVDLIKEAIRLRGSVASFHCNLGNALDSLGRFDEAIRAFNEALKLNPSDFDAHNNLGTALLNSGRLDAAITSFVHAAKINPDHAVPHNNLGDAFKAKINMRSAIESYEKSTRLDPGFLEAYSNLIVALVYASEFPASELVNRAREFDAKFAAPVLRQRPFSNVVDADRRLRIGFVSGDFRKHAVSYFFEPLLAHLDRGQLEVFGYYSNSVEDAMTARLNDSFDHWRNIRALDDDAAADLIEADKVDILVDLSSHTGANRLLVFARKPAPVQVTWLGFSATTGLQAIDYRITDVHAEPVGLTEHLNVETLWRLPRIFCCYQGADPAPAVIDHPPKDDNGYVTFGCLNAYIKLTDPVLALWARVLARLPDARLMLEIFGLEETTFRAEVEARLAKCGLPLDRLLLVPRSPANQFVLYNQIDIALDPFPSNGGTTSMDTLWMGVPLVTLAGDRFSSRMGVTILTNAGLSELIAADEAQYVEIAAALASDDGRLRSLRHNLRERVMQSPLMDQAAFARDMEAAYRGMWKIWCEQRQ